MKRQLLWTVLLIGLVFPGMAWSNLEKADVVDVRVVSDSGNTFSKYRTYPRNHQEGKFFYMEAVKGERYAIEVTNKSDGRIGIAIAVDGRNIIDGKKSDLKQNEQMYILEPYSTHLFEGWRTGMDRTNRFYFTESSGAYAEKVFADASAIGTIALAVYKEKLPEITPHAGLLFQKNSASAGSTPCAPGESRSSDRLERKKESEQAGTGFGETTYSPAHRVHFDPERHMAEKIVLKYEWRSELCKKGILPCGPKNRFWPDGYEFAPIPKDFKG